MPNLVGHSLGGYRIVEQIGLGGMAAVFKAYQPAMHRHVALKVLTTHLTQEPTFVQRFRQEAKVVARLEHVNILPVYDYGEEDGYLYLVMRFIEAGTLKERLEDAPLSLEEVRHVVAQVGSALTYAHRQGVVHRDLKPSNVLIDSQGDCYLTDFGIAKMLEGTSGLTGSGVLGTPHYMSPEQAQALDVDRRADIYAMGVVIYEMLTGRLPFDAETPFAVLMKHLSEPLPLPRSVKPDLPEGVERVILKALTKDPVARYQDMRDLAADFEWAVDSAPVEVLTEVPSSVPMSEAVREGRSSSVVGTGVVEGRRLDWRSPWLLAAIGLLGVLLVTMAIVLGRVSNAGDVSGAQSPVDQGTLPSQVAATPHAEESAVVQALTLTPTPVPPTPTRTPTQTPTPLPEAVVEAEVADVWAGPGVNYEVVGQTWRGGALQVTGQDPTGDWLKVVTADGTRGWVAAMWLQINVPLDAVAVAAVPDTPTPTITPTPTVTPTLPPAPTFTPTLAPSPTPAPSPMPASSGPRIAYVCANGYLCVMNADGSQQTRLMTDMVGIDAKPAWSPDGTRIAFVRDGDIYVINADGSGQINLTDGYGDNEHPAWSPDGTRIAFVFGEGYGGSRQIYMMPAPGAEGEVYAGGEWIRLTDGPGQNYDPAWSPDGTRIAFTSTRDGSGEIYVMPAPGAEVEPGFGRTIRLTHNQLWDTDPAWSPDSTRIVYVHDFQIYMTNAFGDWHTRLTDVPGGNYDPAWSPDGAQIAFTSTRDGNGEIYVMPAPATQEDDVAVWAANFTNSPATSERQPTWSLR